MIFCSIRLEWVHQDLLLDPIFSPMISAVLAMIFISSPPLFSLREKHEKFSHRPGRSASQNPREMPLERQIQARFPQDQTDFLRDHGITPMDLLHLLLSSPQTHFPRISASVPRPPARIAVLKLPPQGLQPPFLQLLSQHKRKVRSNRQQHQKKPCIPVKNIVHHRNAKNPFP